MEIAAEDALADYYDIDCPGPEDDAAPENFDERAVDMGLAHDVPYYVGVALRSGSPVLDLGAGTGRIALPLARAGLDVIAIDSSSAMLRRLGEKLERESSEVRARVRSQLADLADQEGSEDAAVAILAFGALNCIPDFSSQQRALCAVARRLRPGGLIALDVQNPLLLAPDGDASPRLVHLRKNRETGGSVARYAMFSAPDSDQRVSLRGFYEEAGVRRDYDVRLRMIHRLELESMLSEAGLEIVTLSGGPSGQPYSSTCRRIYVVGRRQSGPTPPQAAGLSWTLPSDESLVGVAGTALATAAARAAETLRPDRLFADPLSRRLAGARGAQLLAALGGPATAAAVAARTRWFDLELNALIAAGIKNVISIGAGLDTRPYRISGAAGVRWIEVDWSYVLDYKHRLLVDQAGPAVARVPLLPSGQVDNALIDDAIHELGGDPRAPRVTILEGVLPYITREHALRRLRDVAGQSLGSTALFDIGSPQQAQRDDATARLSDAPIMFATSDASTLCAEAGLRAEVTYLGASDAHFGRLARSAGDRLHPPPACTFLVRATQQ